MPKVEVLEKIPELMYQREIIESSFFESDDLTVSFHKEKLESICLYFIDKPAKIPKQIYDGYFFEFLSTEKKFKHYLDEHNITFEKHYNILQEYIGIKLVSGVIILFDNDDVYSIRKTNIFDN